MKSEIEFYRTFSEAELLSDLKFYWHERRLKISDYTAFCKSQIKFIIFVLKERKQRLKST